MISFLRIMTEVDIGMPTITDRQEIIKSLLQNVDQKLQLPEAKLIARKTPGFVGSDLALLAANLVRTSRVNSDVRSLDNHVFF